MEKICLTGGGTGGHITPLLAIYKELYGDYDFFWIGENDSLEQKIAQKNNIKFFSISAGKLRRYFSFKNFLEPFKIIYGIGQSFFILWKNKPKLIISKGGYVSLPVGIAAKFLGIQLFLHESDTVPGLANRLVGKFASRVYLGFEKAGEFFDPKKTKVVGQILSPELIRIENGELRIENKPKTNLLIIAGSQGSSRIFTNILTILSELTDYNITVILGTLNIGYKKEFEKYNNVEIYEFVDARKMGEILTKTDIAITRAGATSLAELEYFQVKMIIIPLPESANNHQFFNAKFFQEKGETMIEEKNLSNLKNEVLKLSGYKKQNFKNKGNLALEVIREDINSL